MLAMMIRISPKVKRIYLQRFLLSKFVYFKEELRLKDLCCLFENQLWLEKKCQSDPEFRSKFGKDLESLSIILKEINFRTETTDRTIEKFARRLKENLSDFILPRRNYSEAKKKCNGSFQLKDSQSQGKLKRQLPPKSYIGIGYRDKGSAKNVAKDGSPSWQEVATHRGPIYHKGKKYDNPDETNEGTKSLARRILDLHERAKRGK
jgi:hypothetical protein